MDIDLLKRIYYHTLKMNRTIVVVELKESVYEVRFYDASRKFIEAFLLTTEKDNDKTV